MKQLKVIVNKLNKRTDVPFDLSEQNIVGTVLKGYLFEGDPVQGVPNPSLGPWYRDADGYCYWGGGLSVLDRPLGLNINIPDLPYNLPSPFRVGIDISHYNALPDWESLRYAGISFVYIKTSEGVGTPDAAAKDLAIKAKEGYFKIGYYHFCRPDTRNGGTVVHDAEAEAGDALGRIASLTPPDLPLVLDLEDQQSWDTPLAPDDYLLWINTFINKIKDHTGVAPILYSRQEYLDQKLPSTHHLGDYKLWISRYSQRDARQIACPGGWQAWSLWQFREDGVIGRNSRLDLNILTDPSLF